MNAHQKAEFNAVLLTRKSKVTALDSAKDISAAQHTILRGEPDMNYLIFKLCVLLSFAISSLAVTVKEDGKEVDCSVPCACCREGRKRCGKSHICDSGCIDTVYGNRCEHLCKANCYTCQQSKGTTCTTCRETFYDIDSSCGKTCSVGCIGGKCNYLDGTCSCRKNFKGERCEACVDGRYGSTCDQVCSFGCATLSCDKNTGFCECNGFFIGPKCEICAVGDYGFPGYTGLKCGTGLNMCFFISLWNMLLCQCVCRSYSGGNGDCGGCDVNSEI
ncbi:TIE1-like protein [Mya arenaria]|uniref:TIE1-like protein n=1 Tax=Mya arenaria TaxID=6604 RepID=A0ABY7G660_MYAAR|nr:TIE1-like protein [Mya arenaria]